MTTLEDFIGGILQQINDMPEIELTSTLSTKIRLSNSGHAYFSINHDKLEVMCFMLRRHARQHGIEKMKLNKGDSVTVRGKFFLHWPMINFGVESIEIKQHTKEQDEQ